MANEPRRAHQSPCLETRNAVTTIALIIKIAKTSRARTQLTTISSARALKTVKVQSTKRLNTAQYILIRETFTN